MELGRIELPTYSMRTSRATNCAIAPGGQEDQPKIHSISRLGRRRNRRSPTVNVVAELTDNQVVTVLDRVVAAVNPVLDVLAERDPVGLKGHTFHPYPEDGSRFHKLIHVMSGTLNVTDFPGTAGWRDLSMDKRAHWWVSRIGSVNTIAVAFPSMFGFWSKYLPVASTLGFANQAMVLVAVAREYRVTSRKSQVELLASVLCNRDVDASAAGASPSANLPTDRKSLVGTVWDVAQNLRALSGELDRRPGPAKPLALLRLLPVVGAPFSYVGERLALSKAANLGRRWIVDHRDAISPES